MDLLLSNATESSKLFRNNGDFTFNDTAAAAGFEDAGDIGKVVGFFDSDNDGDLDIVSNSPITFWRNNLYDHNTIPTNDNAFLKVMAFGNGTANKGSPYTPIGAQINVTTMGGTLLAHREHI